MTPMELARALREDKAVHYNCCQSVLAAFADRLGMSKEQACALGSHFGSGMRCGGTCGALTGALMVLGLAGKDETAARQMMAGFQTENGYTDCARLLASARERGVEKKVDCDRLVYHCVDAVTKIMDAK